MVADHFQYLAVAVETRDDTVDEVGPIELADEHARVLQSKLGDNVLSDPVCGGCSVRVERGPWEMLLQGGQSSVLGPEIVTPMADAVRLVDGKGVNIRALGERQEPCGQHALRCNEHQSILSSSHFGLDLLAFRLA